MTNFPIVELGQIAKLINGDRGVNYPSKDDFVESGIPFVNAGHLSDGEVSKPGMNFVSPQKYESLGSGKLKRDDIIYCLRGSLGKTAVYRSDAPAAIASSLVIIRPAESCSVDYLFHYLAGIDGQRLVKRFDNGSSQPNLSAASVKQYPIPLPPLSEQKRIAEILDRAESLRRQRRAALTLLDELTQSIFLDMFGDPVSNPKGWKQSTVAELCGERADNCVGGPFGSDLTQADYVESPGVPVVRGQNLSTDEPFMSEKGFVFVSDAKARKLSRNTAIRGDVLVSQRGARLAGQVALIPPNSQYENYIVSQSQMRIRPDTSVVDPLYLVYYFRSGPSVRRMESLTISTGVPHINLGILRNFVVEVPNITLQREFVSRAGEVSKLKATVQKAETNSASLFASLQHRAFRGEL